MLRKRFALALVLIAAATSLALVLTSTGSAQLPLPRTVSFVAHFGGGTNHPKGRLTPGTILTAKSAVFDSSDTNKVGRTSEQCLATVAKPFTMQCVFSLLLKDGELTIDGAINPTKTPWSAPVVGGTGAYDGASGTVTDTSLHGKKERLTFNLTG